MKIVENEPHTYVLPENVRHHFKSPLDVVYRTEEEIKEQLDVIVKSDKGKIISVGDETTKNLMSLNYIPNIAIIDEHIQRTKIDFVPQGNFRIIEVSNPAASITKEAWSVIKDAMKMDDTKIIIKITGEEDLLALPAILEAPIGSFVLYGQPNEGLVIVSVTNEKKNIVRRLIQKMVRINGHKDSRQSRKQVT